MVYAAPDEAAALEELESFGEKWNSKYPKIFGCSRAVLNIQQVCNITSANPCPAGVLSSASVNKEIILLRISKIYYTPKMQCFRGVFLLKIAYKQQI